MVTAGDKPGTGFYFCVQCGHRVYLIGTDRLPPCTKCHGTQYRQGCLTIRHKTADPVLI